MASIPFATVANEAELNQDLAAVAGGKDSYAIAFAHTFAPRPIALTTPLQATHLDPGGSLTSTASAANSLAGAQTAACSYSGDLNVQNTAATDGAADGQSLPATSGNCPGSQ